MKRLIVPILAIAAVVTGLAVGMLAAAAAPGAQPRPGAGRRGNLVARAANPVADALADAHAVAHAAPHPDALADAGPDARSRPGAPDRRPRSARGRRPAPDRGHDRRPERGPTAVRLQRGVGRLAGTGRRRHPALHADLPGEHPGRRRSRPQRPLLLHRLGGRMAGRLRPCRRLAAGPRRRSARRATASSSSTPTSSAGASRSGGSRTGIRRTTSTRTASTSGASPRRSRRRMAPMTPVWRSRPTCGPSVRPRGGRIDVAYSYNKIRYDYDCEDEHVPALGHRREAPDRRRDRRPGRRRRTSSSC